MTEDLIASTELIEDEVILWQDHAHDNGYRPTLKLLTLKGGFKCIELNVHGCVIRRPYTFPYRREDRL